MHIKRRDYIKITQYKDHTESTSTPVFHTRGSDEQRPRQYALRQHF